MNTKIFSHSKEGFFCEKPHSSIPLPKNETGPELERPVLGYAEFYTGTLRLFWGSEKWGIVLPMEVAKNLPIIMPISTCKSDAGALIQVSWVAEGGTEEYLSPAIAISEPGNVEFVVIPAKEIEKFSAKTVNIRYSISLDGEENHSSTLDISVAPPLNYQRAIIEGVVDGTLDSANYPNGLVTTVPAIGNLREYNALSLFWEVTYGEVQLFKHMETTQASTPLKDFLFNIPARAYAPYPGARCRVGYNIWLGAEMDPSLKWATGIIEFDLK